MYKGESHMDSKYNGGSMTVSDKNKAQPTPHLDRVCGLVEDLAYKMEQRVEEEALSNPVGVFTKMLMCFVCCARIILGDSDEDVKNLKAVVADEAMKLGCAKEILANPDRFSRGGFLN